MNPNWISHGAMALLMFAVPHYELTEEEGGGQLFERRGSAP